MYGAWIRVLCNKLQYRQTGGGVRATLTIRGCGVPPIEPADVLALMAAEGLVCSQDIGPRRLEFVCYGQAAAFRRFASSALMLSGVTSVTLQRTDCTEQRSPSASN
jgi:hypothetical protein